MNKSILSNKWFQFTISAFNIVYLILIGMLTIWTFLYDIRFNNEAVFYTLYITLSVIFCATMFISRKQFITRTLSMLLLFPVFALAIFNLENPILYLPCFIVGVFMFFACGAHANTKVIMGTIYLLLYIVGVIGFMLIYTLFSGNSTETVLTSSLTDVAVTSEYDMDKIAELNANSVSPDGKYRYYIIDVRDNDRGKVIIVVEPNDMDINYKFFTLLEAGYTSKIAKNPTRGITPDIEWVSSDTIRYRFGENAEWKTSTVKIPDSKNYLRFLGV